MAQRTLEGSPTNTTPDADDLPRLEPETLRDLEGAISKEGTQSAIIEARRNVKDLIGGNDFAVHDPETGETKVLKVTDIGSAALSDLGRGQRTTFGDPSYTQAMEERWEHQ